MLNQDFKELLRLFAEHGVEYLVVGGYAMAAHGYPRFTGDIDVWIWAKPDNAERVYAALKEFGFGSVGLQVDDFLQAQSVIQLGYPPARIDLLTDIDGVGFAECWQRRKVVPMEGIDLPVVGLDDLIRNKEASGRLQDLADLEKLRSGKVF
jgi:hypothetical protein